MHEWYVYTGRGEIRTSPDDSGGNSTTFCANERTAKAIAFEAFVRGEFRGARTVKRMKPQKFVGAAEITRWLESN